MSQGSQNWTHTASLAVYTHEPVKHKKISTKSNVDWRPSRM